MRKLIAQPLTIGKIGTRIVPLNQHRLHVQLLYE